MSKSINFIILTFFIVFCIIFTCIFSNNERSIYSCDFIEQNLFYYDFGSLLLNNPKEFLKEFSIAIYSLNRNPFLNIFLLPFYFVFKESRLGYILAIVFMFMFPSIILLFKLIKKYFIDESLKTSVLYQFLLYSTIFLFPMIWISVISGIPDICGLVFILFSFHLYFSNKFDNKLSFNVIILFSILLYLSFLVRRWYSVVILSFLLSIFIENIIYSIINFENIKSLFKKNFYSILNILLITIIITALACIFQWNYINSIFSNEISERALYSVNYNQIPYLTYQNLGYFCIVFSVLGIIFNIKNSKVRFIILNFGIYIFLYLVVMNNQLLWINHYLYIACCIVIFYTLGLSLILKNIQKNIIRNLVIILFIIFNFINFLTFYLFEKPSFLEGVLPTNQHHPAKDINYEKISRLLEYLELQYSENKNIKIVQYGLNKSCGYYQFRSISPQSYFVKNNILPEIVIDSDIKDINQNTDYIILLYPLGLFTDKIHSAKVIELSNQLLNKYGIGKKYELIKNIDLNGEQPAKIYLYKKIKV